MPVPAGVIRYRQMSTVVALVLITTQCSRSAGLDGAHDPQMIAGYEILYRQAHVGGKSPLLQGHQMFASEWITKTSSLFYREEK